jgi:hypothetical protein
MRRQITLVSCFVAALAVSRATPSVQIFTDRTSPQPVGTIIGVSAVGKDEGDPDKYMQLLRYRFSVAEVGDKFRIVRDFTGNSELAWRPELYEHDARLKVTILNTKTKETADEVISFRINPRVTGGSPVVVHTSHPLVALFSFPSCPDGSHFRIAYQRQGETLTRRTGLTPCQASHTSNQYVAGMRADSDYTLRAEILTGDKTHAGPACSFRTGVVNETFGRFTVSVPPTEQASRLEPFVLFNSPGRQNFASLATDTDGNLVWYLPSSNYQITRMLPGGRFLAFGNQMRAVAEIDLLGNVIRETTMARIAEQMEAMGVTSVCKQNGGQCVSGFHHESIGLPNGHIIAVGTIEKVIPKGAQDSDDPINIAATLLVDLDEDMQLKWFWNAFDHMDLKRKSKDNGKCGGTNGGLACAPVFLTQTANDWLHGNALSYVRTDGNLTLSFPEQDWVVKIDYANGKGSGKLLWKLGDEGDFKAVSSEAKPWFSFQHDAAFEPPDSNMMVLLDNGHRRVEKAKEKDGKDKEPDTRGQVWKIDESAHTATLVTNADLGVYAPAMGSAHRLRNGNYHFTTGTFRKDGRFGSRSIEVTPDGKIVYMLETPGTSTYRSNRVADLYTPPDR